MMAFKGQILVYKPHTLLDLHCHLTSSLQSFNIMPGKDTFHVNKKYLKNANYSLALGNDTYVASFQERILIGPVCLDDTGEALFTKKAIVIPSQSYFELINAVRRAEKSYEENSEEPWEVILFRYSRVNHVVAKYEKWEDNDPLFKIQIKWNHKADRSYQRLVEMGVKDAIDTSTLIGDWLFLKRNAYLDKDQVEMLKVHLATILEYSFYEVDSKKLVLEFIDFVASSSKLRQFVLEKLKTYDTLNYQSKMKILRHLVNAMFEEKEMQKDGKDFGIKSLLEALSHKVLLVFSLFNHRLQ